MKKRSVEKSGEAGIPQGFVEEMAGLPALDAVALCNALGGDSPVSIKLNRRKIAPEDVATLGYEGLKPVPWCGSGFYLPERPQFTLNPLLHAGAFYVQEAGSMAYESIVGAIADRIPEGPVLDLCAAPGGKTTSIINALPDGKWVVANEFMPKRAQILVENLSKWGYPDLTVTNSPTSSFGKIRGSFALVAVDAPCSGEGMMRKEPVARSQWSPGLVRQCAALQREILEDAAEALMPGGYLIYSTCTFNLEEDEEQLRWLVEEMGLEPIEPYFPGMEGIPRQLTGNYPALRFFPHLTESEGLFCAILRKPGEGASVKEERIARLIDKNCKVLLNRLPGKDYPRYEVDEATALSYLRHNSLTLPAEAPRGIITLTYKGLPLGEVKNLGNRANNLYPKEWRIRNL